MIWYDKAINTVAYFFLSSPNQRRNLTVVEIFTHLKISEPARARTEDPKIKSLLLYQLSYGLILLNFPEPIIP